MSHITGGEGAGEISLELRAIEVYREYWEGLEKKISRFKNVTKATISDGGWLKVHTDLAKFKSPDELPGILEQLENRIIRACKAQIPRVRKVKILSRV